MRVSRDVGGFLILRGRFSGQGAEGGASCPWMEASSIGLHSGLSGLLEPYMQSIRLEWSRVE